MPYFSVDAIIRGLLNRSYEIRDIDPDLLELMKPYLQYRLDRVSPEVREKFWKIFVDG